MEVNRNQYFMVGMVVLLLGIQFRLLDSFVLNERSTKFLAKRMGKKADVMAIETFQAIGFESAPTRKTIRPPQWIGWAMVSFGAVLVLHSLALRKPG